MKGFFGNGKSNRKAIELLFDRLSGNFSRLGFGDPTVDLKEGGCGWTKPAFDGHLFEIFVWPQSSLFKKGGLTVYTNIFVLSDRQMFVENKLRLHECTNLRKGNNLCEKSEPISVLTVPLTWLVTRWEPKASPETIARWQNFEIGNAEECAEDIFRSIKTQGAAFLEFVGTPGKLAETLSNLHKFPDSTSRSGPLSSDASQFAAVLLHDLGRNEEALDELESELKILEARVNRGERDEIALDILRCKKAKYEAWIREMQAP